MRIYSFFVCYISEGRSVLCSVLRPFCVMYAMLYKQIISRIPQREIFLWRRISTLTRCRGSQLREIQRGVASTHETRFTAISGSLSTGSAEVCLGISVRGGSLGRRWVLPNHRWPRSLLGAGRWTVCYTGSKSWGSGMAFSWAGSGSSSLSGMGLQWLLRWPLPLLLACFLPYVSDIVGGGGPRQSIVGHCNFVVLCVWFLAGLDVSFRVCESSAPLSESRRRRVIGLRPVFRRKLAWRR